MRHLKKLVVARRWIRTHDHRRKTPPWSVFQPSALGLIYNDFGSSTTYLNTTHHDIAGVKSPLGKEGSLGSSASWF